MSPYGCLLKFFKVKSRENRCIILLKLEFTVFKKRISLFFTNQKSRTETTKGKGFSG